MHYKIRKGVFETNSSTQHTLTIQRQVDSSATTGRIPSDSVFKFTNSRVENIEDDYRRNKEQQRDLQSARRMARLDVLTGIRNKNDHLFNKDIYKEA